MENPPTFSPGDRVIIVIGSGWHKTSLHAVVDKATPKGTVTARDGSGKEHVFRRRQNGWYAGIRHASAEEVGFYNWYHGRPRDRRHVRIRNLGATVSIEFPAQAAGAKELEAMREELDAVIAWMKERP